MYPTLGCHPKNLPSYGDSCFPVGVEYYRPPVPPTEFWDGDFARIRAAGMRIIRAFPYWNWIEPAPGQFEFEDLDLFFDLAEKHDLKVWLDITAGTHGACPTWLIRKYPDMRVQQRDGSFQHPTAMAAAPQGTMIHNFDHPKWPEYAELYIRAVVTRYKDHAAMGIWGTWDGINFAAVWATNDETYPPYNDYTIARYIRWLKERFTLDELNERLLRRYRSWEDVEPPRSTHAPVEMMLYRQFHFENMADHLGWMADLIDRLDGKHEQRSHGTYVPRPWDEITSSRIDSWGLSATSAGILTGEDPYAVADICMGFDWSRAIGRNGRWWHEEIHAGFKKGLSIECKQAICEESTLFLWLALIDGAAGALYWQYRPEYMSFEAPGLNLVSLDGTPRPRWQAIAKAIGQIDSISEHLPMLLPQADVALAYSAPSQEIFLYDGQSEAFNLALKGIYRTLWTQNIPRDIVTPGMDWSKYKVVYLPNFAVMDESSVSRIRKILQSSNAPYLIADGHFGTFSGKGHWSFCPPEGLGDILDVRIADFDKITDKDIREGRNIIETEFGELSVTRECDYAILTPGQNTRAIATLGDQVIAVQAENHRFIWFGLSLSAAFGGAASEQELLRLLDTLGVRSPFLVEGDRLIAFKRESKLGGSLIFLVNIMHPLAKANIQPQWAVRSATDLLTGETIKLSDNAFEVEVTFGKVGLIHCSDE